MNKLMKDVALMAAVGTASYCAYSWLSPGKKRKITNEARKTADDICDVRQDMSDMASTIKDTF